MKFEFLKSIIEDTTGGGSSKRVALLWAMLLVTIIVIGVTFLSAPFIEPVWNGVLTLVISFGGLTVWERYTNKKNDGNI
jgi:hypothetical protein